MLFSMFSNVVVQGVSRLEKEQTSTFVLKMCNDDVCGLTCDVYLDFGSFIDYICLGGRREVVDDEMLTLL